MIGGNHQENREHFDFSDMSSCYLTIYESTLPLTWLTLDTFTFFLWFFQYLLTYPFSDVFGKGVPACCWTMSLGPSGLEHASESNSKVTEALQICRLRTLKMRASGFAFMRDSWVWFNWSKVFQVRMSVHVTHLRSSCSCALFFRSLLFAT